jgi:hypothetical protein
LNTDWERGGSLRRIWEVNEPSDSRRWVLRDLEEYSCWGEKRELRHIN